MRLSTVVKWIGLTLAALLVLARAPQRVARAADGPQLLIALNRTGNVDLFLIHTDGSGAKNLTNHTADDIHPAWSPDGKRIAFCRILNGSNAEIFVMNADGSNPTNLTNDPAHDADPAWAPDGKKIAFVSDRGGQGYALCVMDADGSHVQTLPSKKAGKGLVYPTWSADGKAMAYADSVNEAREIFVCRADGTHPQQLTGLGGINSFAAWSPDGKKIAFQHHEQFGQPGTLYVMDVDGNHLKQVISTAEVQFGPRPAWKPK